MVDIGMAAFSLFFMQSESFLAATIVVPGHNMALPLMPEFVAKQDGAEKQDCERNAAKRWLLVDWEPEFGPAKFRIR